MKPCHSLPLLLACTLAAGAVADERREHGAHVHGLAAMDVSAIGDSVEIVLRSPVINLAGFEHEPRSEAERERMRAVRGLLDDGGSLFAFEGAQCRQESAWSRWHGSGEEHAHDQEEGHGHDDEDHGHGHDDGDGHAMDIGDGHAEIHAHFRFHCDGPPSAIAVGLFERFSGTDEIRAQFVTDSTQGAQSLTADSAALALE